MTIADMTLLSSTPLTLEDKLVASLAIARKCPAVLPETSRETTSSADLFIMPKPPPAAGVPAILSPSSVNGFLDCQVRWYYRKVLKLDEERGAALGLGTAVHHALIENYRQKIETREDLDTIGAQTLFVQSLTEQLDTIKLQPDESADDLKQAGEIMVRVYMDRAAPLVDPAAVEERVEGLVGDVPAHGYIDIRDVHGRIIDIKTAKKRPSGLMPAHRLQVATYAMLHPQASGLAQLATLTKTKTVALHQDTIEITPADKKLTTRLYSLARDQMQTGIYSPNRSSFLCSRRYCSFWELCESQYGGEVSA